MKPNLTSETGKHFEGTSFGREFPDITASWLAGEIDSETAGARMILRSGAGSGSREGWHDQVEAVIDFALYMSNDGDGPFGNWVGYTDGLINKALELAPDNNHALVYGEIGMLHMGMSYRADKLGDKIASERIKDSERTVRAHRARDPLRWSMA